LLWRYLVTAVEIIAAVRPEKVEYSTLNRAELSDYFLCSDEERGKFNTVNSDNCKKLKS